MPLSKRIKTTLFAALATTLFMLQGCNSANPVTPPNDGGGIACTQEAKQCPDGSYVGRSGPRCEFAACPQKSKGAM